MALNEPCMGACHECGMMCAREHGTSREICHGGSLRPPCFYKMVSEYCVEGPACWMVRLTFLSSQLQVFCKLSQL
jgi:hypothetical protein